MAQNKGGNTPLQKADNCFFLLGCRLRVIQVLVTAGVDAKAKNEYGKTACYLTQETDELKGAERRAV